MQITESISGLIISSTLLFLTNKAKLVIANFLFPRIHHNSVEHSGISNNHMLKEKPRQGAYENKLVTT